MDIYCFGDSITFGEFDTERGGWVDRLKTACMARFVATGQPGDSVFNLGISGETTRMMRARFGAELQARFDAEVRSLVLLAYGANDAAESEGSLRVPRDEYVDNLAWAIDEARRLGCEVWLVNVTPVAPSADGVRSATGRLRANAVLARYNEALRELSRSKSVELLDVNAAFRAHELTSLFVADGLHPNAKGHALVFEVVQARLSRQSLSLRE
jgi:acyl-CoA thioesterase I